MSRQIVTNSDGPPLASTVELKKDGIFHEVMMEFERWPVPNYIKVKSVGPWSDSSNLARIPNVSLNGVPQDVFDSLVDAMIDELYEKAGKKSPWVKVNANE